MEERRPGWIKLYRSMLDWEWFDDEKSVKLFVYLLIKANFVEEKWRGQTVLPGQFITSTEKLAEGANLTTSEVRHRLNQFEKSGEITKQAANKFTKITLTNWSKFQGSDLEEFTDSNETTNKQQTNDEQTTNKQRQYKKERKTRKKRSSSASVNGTGSPEFNSIENMSALQEIECQTRWGKILNVWSTSEGSPALKSAYTKFKNLRTEHQQEVVQYVESLSEPKRKILCDFWISTYLKNNMLHPGLIERDLEKRLSFEKQAKPKDTAYRHQPPKFPTE